LGTPLGLAPDAKIFGGLLLLIRGGFYIPSGTLQEFSPMIAFIPWEKIFPLRNLILFGSHVEPVFGSRVNELNDFAHRASLLCL